MEKLDRSHHQGKGICLCQDCLRVVPFSQGLHIHEGSCVCGGDMCGCNGCQQDFELLKAGKQIQTVDGYRAFPDWNAENGVDN